MLLFSLAIQPIIRHLSRECTLLLYKWYVDDGVLIRPINEVAKALKIRKDSGPEIGFQIKISKTRAF